MPNPLGLTRLRRSSVGIRLAALLACAFAATATGAPSPAPAPTSAAPAQAQTLQLSSAFDSPWSQLTSVRAALGWRDNILLSPYRPLARAFARADLESFAQGSFSHWDAILLLNGEVLRYASPPPDTGGEQLWFGHAEFRWRRLPSVRLALKLDAFLQDAVVDLSETETVRTVAPVRSQGAFLGVAPRFVLPAGFALEPLVQLRRTDYRRFSGDHDERRAGARLSWSRGERLALHASWHEHRRDYDDRERYTAGGRALSGTRLSLRQRVGELKASTSFSLASTGRWTAAAAASRTESRDEASGFFDTDQHRLRAELSWRLGRWEYTVEGERREFDYLNQTVGTGTAPPRRTASYDDLALRVERSLGPLWSLFSHYKFERCRSNEPGFSYRSNTVFAGAQRTF